MLGLEVDAPLHRKIKVPARPRQFGDGLGVGQMDKGAVTDLGELFDQPFGDELFKQFEIRRTFGQCRRAPEI